MQSQAWKFPRRIIAVLTLVFMLVAVQHTVVAQTSVASEVPFFADSVAAGELPPVQDRLPSEPLVLEPYHNIGEYGGTFRVAYTRVNRWFHEVGNFGQARLLTIDANGQLVPNLAKGWEVAEDAMSLTLFLREGVKWSDGHPFTADDIQFWYEDVLLNEELTPSIPLHWVIGDEVVRLEKVDDLTVRLGFALPSPHFAINLALYGVATEFYLPKHYLHEFHAAYVSVDELEQKTRAAGFESWWQLFGSKSRTLDRHHAQREIDAPTLTPYVVKRRTVSVTHLERNPYYWKVDPEGNQLPYVDSVRAELAQDAEVLEAKAINGELDLYVGVAANMGLYTRHAESAGIRVLPWTTAHSARAAFYVNQTHKDPVLREILQDVRFRRALSLAIDREEMNDLVWLGLAEPSQKTVVPPSRYYREEFAQAYAEHDPQQANQLLDEMGLEWDSARQYRLRPDGERLTIMVETEAAFADWVRSAELATEFWRELGIQAVMEARSSELYFERTASNEHAIVNYGTETPEAGLFLFLASFVPTDPLRSWQGIAWAQWYSSGGISGEEPPEDIMRLYELLNTWNHDPSDERREEAILEILQAQAENLWVIGTVRTPVRPMIVNSNLRNVPTSLVYDIYTGSAKLGQPETWYFAPNQQ